MYIKNLNEWLIENWKGETINEAFSSSILRDIKVQIETNQKNTDSTGRKTLTFKSAFERNGLRIQWDKVTDDMFEKVQVKDSRRKNWENALLFWFSGDGKILGASTGTFVIQTTHGTWNYRRGVRGRSNYTFEYNTTLDLKRDADYVLALPAEKIKELGTRELTTARYNARMGALAMTPDYEAREDNMKRYLEIMGQRKVAKTDLDDKMSKLMTGYAEVFAGKETQLKWTQMSSITKEIDTALGHYKDYLWIKEHGLKYEHEKDTIAKAEKNIDALYSKLTKYGVITE